MNAKHPFEQFLSTFIPTVAHKSRQMNKMMWVLETTGSADAADLKAELDTELRLLFNDRNTYEKLLEWDRDPAIRDPILKRQLNVLIRTFKQNIIPQKLVEEIATKEAALAYAYTNFRPQLNGKTLSENDIREILKHENDPEQRKKAWAASKEVGIALAPKILELVNLRNQAAQSLGYKDYFVMQLDLQEVDENWLFRTLEDLAHKSEAAYQKTLDLIAKRQSQRFSVSTKELGPWAWSEPFCQEDPLDTRELDSLVKDIDICDVSAGFYQKMGIDIVPTFKRSDMFERPGKNQHAFCINVDRNSDVRTLNNVKQTIKWQETVLHEYGHAIYELGFNHQLPWLLREPPHMITTEAMALIAGRQAYLPDSLRLLVGNGESKKSLIEKAKESLQRRQLIFSRWVLVMSYFERELYRNPKQDLNKLWWQMVEKYQKISMPKNREGKSDWAAKYHIGLAPVYYFSYLLGEMFASAIEEALAKKTGSSHLATKGAGSFLNEKLFFPGNSLRWDRLIENVVGKPLNADAWIHQFAS